MFALDRPRSVPGVFVAFVAAASTSLALTACGGEGADPVPGSATGSASPFGSGGSPTGSAGAGGNVSSAAGTGSVAGNRSDGGAGNVTGLGSGGVNLGNGGAANGSAGSSGATAGSNAGTGGAGGSGTVGAGMGGSGATPATVGRVGAELCPPGPFGSPLPATPTVQKLASVGANDFFNWEGIVWNGSALFFSEITSNNSSQINRFTPGGSLERGVVASTGSNGLAIDGQGNLLLAAHDVGGISRLQLPGGAITRGNQTFNGLRFNSPNDLVLRGDGNIYFTDPDFQSPAGRIQGGTRVYRIAPADVPGTGTVSVVDETFSNPNGITLSPDGNRLYVSGGSLLREFALDAAGAATRVGDFSTSLQSPDGMTVDCAGNIYAVENSSRQIRVFSPAGALLGTIGPNGFDNQGLTNVAFGGANRTTLFVSGFSQGQQGGLYSVQLNVPGLPY